MLRPGIFLFFLIREEGRSQFQKLVAILFDSQIVFHEKRNQLISINQVNRSMGRGAGCFIPGSFGETGSRHDQASFIRSQTAAKLLNDRRLNIGFPSFGLYRQLDMNDIMYRHNASHINASISAVGSPAHFGKSHFTQQSSD